MKFNEFYSHWNHPLKGTLLRFLLLLFLDCLQGPYTPTDFALLSALAHHAIKFF